MAEHVVKGLFPMEMIWLRYVTDEWNNRRKRKKNEHWISTCD